MGKLLYRGDGVFVDDEPVDLERVLPKDWSPALRKISVYWMVELPSMFRTYQMLAIIKGSAKKGKIQDVVNIYTNEWEESYAPLTDIGEAVEMYRRDTKHIFEEFPYVNVETEDEYNRAISGRFGGPKDWSPKGPESAWVGPGVYDFRDRPPTRSYKSVEDYEMVGMEERAKQVMDTTYDDDYKKPLRKLLADYVGGGE